MLGVFAICGIISVNGVPTVIEIPLLLMFLQVLWSLLIWFPAFLLVFCASVNPDVDDNCIAIVTFLLLLAFLPLLGIFVLAVDLKNKIKILEHQTVKL